MNMLSMQRSALEKPVIVRNGASCGPMRDSLVFSIVGFCTSSAEQPASSATATASGKARRRVGVVERVMGTSVLRGRPSAAAAAADQVDRIRGEHEDLTRCRARPATGIDVADVLAAALAVIATLLVLVGEPVVGSLPDLFLRDLRAEPVVDVEVFFPGVDIRARNEQQRD